MSKIFSSIGSLLAVSAFLVFGAVALARSGDTSGETFATGVLKLKIDNESYVTDRSGKLVFSTSTSWKPSSLEGKFFFKFGDVKPGDFGENTISLHSSKEKAWACMSVEIYKTKENGVTEPESLLEKSDKSKDKKHKINSQTNEDGELQKALNFAFWADDGDNVFESDENVFKEGSAENIFDGKWWPLADSKQNAWQKNNHKPTPMPENSVRFVGTAWCFGELTPSPLGQASGGPLVRGTGWKCDGSQVSNEYQTDSIKLDVSFAAMQSKQNGKFVCGGGGSGGGGGNLPSQPVLDSLFADIFALIKKIIPLSNWI